MNTNVIDEPKFKNKQFIFKDRVHAGELLANKLRNYVNKINVQLLAIPAGGVPVGYTVAKNFNFPFDVIIARKIQIPWNTEAGFGAISYDGTVLLNERLITQLGLTTEIVQWCISQTRKIIHERLKKFRGNKPFPELRKKTVILVDDGLASGWTMLAAVKSVRKQSPAKIVVAVPTASTSAVELVAPTVDKLICLNIRSGPVFAVADAYQKWYDLADEEVVEILRKSWQL
ncbi:phosphoribosyltransferase [Candidatus Bathyarchaeota archaeon]|nr:phosphoribosyltransferase [Candidatus Bathyarchaeota archaeon]